MNLTQSDVKALSHAIDENYWYQMYLDNLPEWALLGDSEIVIDPQTSKEGTSSKFGLFWFIDDN